MIGMLDCPHIYKTLKSGEVKVVSQNQEYSDQGLNTTTIGQRFDMENISENIPKNESIMIEMFGDPVDLNCDEHGDYRGYENNRGCVKCMQLAEEEKRKQEAIDRNAAVLASRWSESGMPEKFCGITLDDWTVDTSKQKEVKGLAQSFADGNVTRMLLVGNCGTGKTMLAAGIIAVMTLTKIELSPDNLNRNRYRHLHPVYMTATKLMRSIRDSWKDKDVGEQEVMDQYINADVLVVDELGAGRCTEDDKLILSEILCDRYASDKPTLLITNMTVEQIKESVLDERSVDRMREGGKVVRMDWESRRGSHASA